MSSQIPTMGPSEKPVLSPTPTHVPPTETPMPDCVLPFGDEVDDKKLPPTVNGCEKVDFGCNLIPALGQVFSSFYVSSAF
jgi:hypothetical protein